MKKQKRGVRMLNKERVTIFELILRIFGAMAFTFVVSCIIFPFAKGMPLIGLPDTDDIVKTEIVNAATNERVVLTDKADIKIIKDITGLLTYRINSAEKSDAQGDIVISFEDKNGDTAELSVTEKYVYWNGKERQLKREKVFIDLIEKIVFN